MRWGGVKKVHVGGGLGGRGRGNARRLGCDVGARRKQQPRSFDMALVSCNHQWVPTKPRGPKLCVSVRVPNEWVTRMKIGQEPSTKAHSRTNSIHVWARRNQHACNFSVALLHSNKWRCEGGPVFGVSIEKGERGR